MTLILPIDQLTAQQIDRWHEIQDSSPRYDNAFLSYEFAEVFSRHSSPVEVAVFEANDRIVGFFPFQRARGFKGTGSRLTAMGVGVVDAQAAILEDGYEINWTDLLRAAKSGVIEFDHLIGEQSTEALHSWTVTSPVVELTDGVEVYEKTQKVEHQSRYKTFDRRSRTVTRDFEVDFRVDDFDDEAFSALVNWKSEHYLRSGYDNPLSNDNYRNLLLELAILKTPYCSGVFSVLRFDGEVTAAQLSLKSKTTLSGWVTTYNTEYGKYAPGIEMLRRVLRENVAVGFITYDFGKGDESYKQHLKTGDHYVSRAWAARPTAGAYAFLAKKVPLEKTERFILEHESLRLRVRKIVKLRSKLSRKSD